MVKSYTIGEYYYVKITNPSDSAFSELVDNAPFVLNFYKSGGSIKYRFNGGAWQTTPVGYVIGLTQFANEVAKVSYNGTPTLFSAYTSIEIYGRLNSGGIINSNSNSAKIMLKSAIENPIEIELDKLNCEPHLVSKTTGTNLLYVDTAYGIFREEQNVLTPSIVIEYSKVPDFNYVYIPSLSRYYFVTGITLVRYGVYRVDLKVDVLCTYDSDIRLQSGFVLRNENTYQPAIVDNRYPLSDIVSISYDSSIGNKTPSNFINVEWDYDYDNPLASPMTFIALSVVNDLPITYGTQPTGKIATLSNLPSINRSIGDNPLTMTYSLTYTEWGYVTGTLKSQSSLASYITGVIGYPFKLNTDCLVDSGGVISTWNLKINNLQITDDNNQPVKSYVLKGESSKYWVIADFTPAFDTNFTNNLEFLNFEPYTRFELYIPFKGWINLSSKEILGYRIVVFYATDYTTGDGSVFVYNYTLNKMLYTSPVQIGIKMGTSLTNIEEITKQKQTNVANLMLGLIGSATSVVIGAVTENPLAIVSGILTGTKSIASAINVNRMLIEKANCTIAGDKLGLYGGYKPILKRTYYTKLSITESVYKHTQGYPINQYNSLSSYTGYTEIPDMHYVPSTYKFITKTEIDEIIALAKNGIIL